MKEKTIPASRLKRRFCVAGVIVLLGFVVLIAVFPSVVAKSRLRNSLVNRALADRELHASVGEASFGWFSPVSMRQLEIARNDQTLKIDVDRVEAKKSLLSLLFSLPAVGTVEIDQPHMVVVLRDVPPDDAQEEPSEHGFGRGPGTTLTAVVRGGSLDVRTADSNEPVIDVEGLSLTVRLQRAGSGREVVKRLAAPGEPHPEESLTRSITDLVEGLTRKKKDGAVDVESTAANILKLIRAGRKEKERKKKRPNEPR